MIVTNYYYEMQSTEPRVQSLICCLLHFSFSLFLSLSFSLSLSLSLFLASQHSLHFIIIALIHRIQKGVELISIAIIMKCRVQSRALSPEPHLQVRVFLNTHLVVCSYFPVALLLSPCASSSFCLFLFLLALSCCLFLLRLARSLSRSIMNWHILHFIIIALIHRTHKGC